MFARASTRNEGFKKTIIILETQKVAFEASNVNTKHLNCSTGRTAVIDTTSIRKEHYMNISGHLRYNKTKSMR